MATTDVPMAVGDIERSRPAGSAPLLGVLLRSAADGRGDVRLDALDPVAIRRAVDGGLGPLVLRSTAGDPDGPRSPFWPSLQGAELTARLLAANQLDAMTDILDACDGLAPPPVLLKGISICEQHYPEPHLRPMRDLDFLVEADVMAAVEARLADLGYRQRTDRPAFYRGHHHSAPFVHPDTGVWVEVHRALFPSTSPLAADPLFAPGTVQEELRWSTFRGRRVRRLSAELELAHVACHWAEHLRVVSGMIAMVDATLLLRSTPGVQWERILGRLDTSIAARHLGLLLACLARHRLVSIDALILRRLRPPRRVLDRLADRLADWLLDRYVVAGRPFGVFLNERVFCLLWTLLVLRRLPRRLRSAAPRRPATADTGEASIRLTNAFERQENHS